MGGLIIKYNYLFDDMFSAGENYGARKRTVITVFLKLLKLELKVDLKPLTW